MIMITIDNQEYEIIEALPQMMYFNIIGNSFSEVTGINFKLYDKNTARYVYKTLDRVCYTNVIYNNITYERVKNNLTSMEMLYKAIETDLALDKLE